MKLDMRDSVNNEESGALVLREFGLAVAARALGARQGVVTEDGRPAQVWIDDVVARTPRVSAAVRAELPGRFPMAVADSSLTCLQDAADRLAGQHRCGSQHVSHAIGVRLGMATSRP